MFIKFCTKHVFLKTLLAFSLSCMQHTAMLASNIVSVDVNIATNLELQSIKGIGPKRAQTILDERKKNGPFKNPEDFKNRVNGIGDKSIIKLQAHGLIINKINQNNNIEYQKNNTISYSNSKSHVIYNKNDNKSFIKKK